MPPDASPPPPPADFDPDKTLFFQRRKKASRVPLIVVCLLLAGSAVLVLWTVTHPARPAVEEVADTPYRSPEVSSKLADAPHAPPSPSVVPEAAPSVPPAADPAAPLNLDVKDPGNAQVRDEVLHRVDLMPGVSAANKDKLYASVDHARSMGRVLTIPFVKGETAVRGPDVERLRHQLESPAIRQMTDDPTVVFVILGYADTKGSDKINAEVSLNRARNVLDTLRDKCGLQNVMHAVAMGGSTLFSTQQADKNRVVEVWAVLP